MKEYIFGLIGAGNMAQAILKGALKKDCLKSENVFAYDIDAQKLEELKSECNINLSGSLKDLCNRCDIVLLAVKPNIIESLLQDIKEYIGTKTVVSIAAGWSAAKIKSIIGQEKKVIRLMPNTPLLAGEGMSVFETPSTADKEETEFIEKLFLSLGRIDHAPAKLMDAVTAVSGSGPAYVFMFIEALADAGVLCGLPRAMSMTLASQTVLGSAKMVMDTGLHPGVLKDAVCSPGGTTIEAVKSLEEDGFRGAVINAAQKCALKSKKLAE